MNTDRAKQFFPILGALVILSLPGLHAAAINWTAIGNWLLNWLRSFTVYLIIGLLVIWLIPKLMNRWTDIARHSTIKSLGFGIVVLIVGYAALVILFVLLLAIGIFFYVIRFSNLASIILNLGVPGTALAFGIFNLVVNYLSKLVIVFLIGKLLWQGIYPKALSHKFWGSFLALLIGLVIYLLVRAIPWLGWVIGCVVTLIGLGAIGLSLFTRPAKVTTVVEEPAPTAGVVVPETIIVVDSGIPDAPSAPAQTTAETADLPAVQEQSQTGEYTNSEVDETEPGSEGENA